MAGESYVQDRLDIYVGDGHSSELCGFPSFCKHAAAELCRNITLLNCPECSTISAVVLISAISLLGAMILITNGFLIWCIATKPAKFSGAYNTIKLSLAFADVATGVDILVVAVYNFSWTINSTTTELNTKQLSLRGSPQAIIGGMFFNLSYSASLNHLVYLALQRLYAIRWPLRYKLQSHKTVKLGLAVVWIVSVLLASIGGWFPNTYTFTYSHLVFMFNVTVANTEGKINTTPLLVLISVVYLLPFCVLTLLLVITVVYIYRSQPNKKRNHSSSDFKPKNYTLIRREVQILKTVAFMQFGFTITLLPVCLVAVLMYNEVIQCEQLSAPMTVCFYLSMTNSVVNIIVYSCRDENFRDEVYMLLSKLCFPCCAKPESTKQALQDQTYSIVT